MRTPIRGRKGHIEIDPPKLPGKVSAAGTNKVNPREVDQIRVTMQELQYGSPSVRKLLAPIAKSCVPCMSITNAPPLPHIATSGTGSELLKSTRSKCGMTSILAGCYPVEKVDVLLVLLRANFKVVRSDD